MYYTILWQTIITFNKVFTTLKNKQLHCIKLHTGLSDEGCSVPDEVENDEEGGLVNTNERVREVMQSIPDITEEVTITSLPTDMEESEVIASFMSQGCGCNKKCNSQFTTEYVTSMRATCAELSHSELDMAILGQLSAFVNTSAEVSTASRHKERERKKSYTSFLHQGKPVCSRMFQFLHGIGIKRLKNLTKAVKENGLTPRVHGNTKRKPKHALSYTTTEFVVRFLFNYAEQNALVLPGRVPGYSRTDIQLLPSSVSKRAVWRVYREAVGTVHAVAYSTFCLLWRTLVPSIVICKESVRAHFVTNGDFSPPQLASSTPHNSKDIKVHYSFDYAQQVHYPSDPLQPGPIYFLTPRKCTIFGVNCEAIPRQVNFLTDEAGDCGKGANAVVSRIHYFFAQHGLGEKHVYLHADNCTGQNKNNCMIQYLMWRVLTSRHTNITLSFLPVGHTKFSPDWCFGLFKRQYRRTKVSSLQSIAEVVNNSAECNHAQLVSREDGTTIAPTYDWADFFATRFKKITGIKKYHHFRMSSSAPGCVFVKEQYDSREEKLELLKEPWNPSADTLPSVIPPRGLSLERQWYLHEQIRPFCAEEDKDTTCPRPSAPKPAGSRAGTPHLPDRTLADQEETAGTPPPKRRRVCGICKEPGHDKRNCLKK